MKHASRLTRFGCSALFTLMTLHQASAIEKLKPTTRVAATQQVEFDVLLPITHRAELDQLLVAQQTQGSPQYHQWITPSDFRQRFGPNQADVARVTDFLQSYGISVTKVHSHGLRVKGNVGAIEHTFSTSIWNGVGDRGTRKMIAGSPLVMPPTLAQAGAQVVGFSSVIRNRIHSKTIGEVNPKNAEPNNRNSPIGGYWSTDLREAYQYPSYLVVTGKGVNVGVLMSSDYGANDMALYFGHEKLSVPKIIRRPVFGGAPYDPVNNGATFEVELDIQQVGGMAPGATITLYNIPDLSDESIIAGYIEIVEYNEVDVVNSSFGGFEADYFPEYNQGQDYTGILNAYDDLFKQGNVQGITFVASSGDSGGLDNPPVAYLYDAPTNSITGYFTPGVEFPASSPHVTSVGGTNLVTTYVSGSLQSNYVSEQADGDPELPYDPYGIGNLVAGGYWGSGGGVSGYFTKPDYQKLVTTGAKYRTVPDLSLHMGGCPGGISVQPCGPDRSYDLAYIGGKLYGLIGTSASSPDFAGLLALQESYKPGRVGNVNYQIYTLAQSQFAGTSPVQYFHANIPGFNGYDQTKKNKYNLVLGNGTVIGKNFVGLASSPAAGDPQTSTNP